MDVLIAHGGEASRQSLARALEGRDHGLLEAADGGEALERLLAADAPRVALVDWDLSGIEGPELCRLVRDFHLEKSPYVILLAAAAHHGEVAVGLEAGANDCVRTPVSGAELRARIEMARRFIELPWGREKTASGPLRGDAPTGVRSHEEIVQRLDEELARAQRDGAELSIGILDIGGLARVNERCGRRTGDAVLQEVIARARTRLRPFDAIGRLGGEEFLIVIPKTGELDVAGVLERLRGAMAAEPFTHDGEELGVTVGIGGITAEGESPGELIAAAEAALAAARSKGPNSVVVGREVTLEAVLTPR